MIICVTGWFPIYKDGIDTGKKEFVVSHGINSMNNRTVILPSEHPEKIGAKYYPEWDAWIL